jgi:hypothetical protein
MKGIPKSSKAATNVYFDSESTITMGNSYGETKHTRHIMRRYHNVREGIALNIFASEWINTVAQVADIGTKQTPGPRHLFLMELHINISRSRSKRGKSIVTMVTL